MSIEAENCSSAKTWHINNGNKALDLSTLPRCTAIAATTGEPCKRAALKGQELCGIHAGRYKPGPQTYNKPALVHGLYTAQAKQERAEAWKTLRSLNNLLEFINNELQKRTL